MNRVSALPARPNLEYLKKLAKQRVAALRRQGKTASLGEAQLALARSYGFPSWRKLKSHIDQLNLRAGNEPGIMPAGSPLPTFDEMMRAITNRDHATFAQLLAAAPAVANQTGPHPRWGGRPQLLHVAIESDNDEAFKLLLDSGAGVDGDNQGYDGWSPLMIAIHSKRDAMRDELIRRHATVDLIAALMLGDDRRVTRLLRDPAALRGPFPNNATPLHFARTVKSARLLISRGVDVEATDKYGKTPPQLWVDAQPSSAAMRRLAASFGVTPAFNVFKAVEQGRLAQVRKFLASGADVNARFPEASNHTLLHAAAFGGDLAMTRLLVAKGADVRALDREHNSTPAGWARFALKAFNRKPCEAVAEYLESRMST